MSFDDMKQVIDRALIVAPDVLAEAVNMPHYPPLVLVDPATLNGRRPPEDRPFCGCFIGELALAFDVRRDELCEDADGGLPLNDEVYEFVARELDLDEGVVIDAAIWCGSSPRDRKAIAYAEAGFAKLLKVTR